MIQEGMVNRWALSEGAITMAYPGGDAIVRCGDASATAATSAGVSTLSPSDALALMPSLGVHDLDWGGVPVTVEHVGARYCHVADIIAYGRRNGDGFDNSARYPRADIEAAIAAAEDVIDSGTRRSFCRRMAVVALKPGLNELPFEDAQSATAGELLHGRQIRVDSECTAEVVYGAYLDQRVRDAACMLAASYLRPRVGAENVRGQSMDGVYVSYTLATGEEGGETGLPEVDAVIASHRSHRAVVM